MDTTQADFERLASMFRNGLYPFPFIHGRTCSTMLLVLAKQNIDASLQACVDRYWNEIISTSFVFDRHSREVSAARECTGELDSID